MGFILGLRLLGTSHPPPESRMEERRQGERGWGGGGQGEGAFISGSHSPAFSHLHPSLSLSVHLSSCFLTPLAVNLDHPPSPKSVSSLLGRAPGPPHNWDTGSPPGWEWKKGVLGKLRPGFPGAWEGVGGQVLEGCQPLGYESELSAAPAPPVALAWAPFALVPAQLWPVEAHTLELSPLPVLREVQLVSQGPLGPACTQQSSWAS